MAPSRIALTWLALTACVALPASAQGGREAVMTLEEAIRYALANQPDVVSAAAQERVASGQLRSERSGQLPSLSLSASENRYENDVPGSPRSSTSIRGSQLIYDTGRTGHAVAAARSRREAARADREDVQLLVAGDVAARYYALLEAKGIRDVNADTVRDREALLAQAQARLTAGTVARFDVLRAESDLSESRRLLVEADGAVRQARAALNTAMGRPATAPLDTVEPPERTSPSPEEALALAVASRPDLRAARLQAQAARQTLSSTRRGNAPALYASGSMDGAERDFPTSSLDWSVGLNLSWDAFDGGRTAGQVESARGSLSVSEAALRRVELAVTQEVTQASIELDNAREQVDASETAVRQATEARDAALGRYQAGVGTQLDATTAETQLLQARVSLVNARYRLAAARTALEVAVGRLPLS